MHLRSQASWSGQPCRQTDPNQQASSWGGQAAHGPEAEVKAVWLRSPGLEAGTVGQLRSLTMLSECKDVRLPRRATLHADTAVRRRDTLSDQLATEHDAEPERETSACRHELLAACMRLRC